MKFVAICTSLLLAVSAAFAQGSGYKNEIGFQTDNDGFLGQGSDRYYTAGNFVYFNQALKLADTARLANKVLGFSFGQKIYTPYSGQIPDPSYVDRPFAGYLYIGSSLNLLYKNESNLKLEAQFGVIGPAAQGQQVQDLIHKTFGFYTPEGWEYQIHNSMQLNLSAVYNDLLFRIDNVDLSFNSYADVGTGLTAIGAGGTLRVGTLSPLYNSISTWSTVTTSKKAPHQELFVYYKPLVNVTAYDATIQGGMFTNQMAPNEIVKQLEPVVLSQQVGGSLVMGHWVVDASAIFQSHNTPQMLKTEQWGSITALYRFN